MKINEQGFLSVLDYNPANGWFTWKISRPGRWGIKAGDRAGSSLKRKCGKRYRRVVYCGEYIAEHRLAFLFMTNSLPSEYEEIDHQNGNGEDNHWENLTLSNRKLNSLNLRKRSDNTSGVTGVSWCPERNKWMAHIHHDSRMKNLGRFNKLDDAIAVRKKAEIELGFHKNHGSDRPL